MKRFLLLAAIAALPLSCGNRSRSAADPPSEPDTPAVVEILHGPDSLNDIASIFAGLQVDSASAWFGHTRSSAWQRYAASMDSRWKPCKEGLDKVDAFARDSLADIRARAKTVFYPFSGPDFAYPATLFPDADTIITAALEPVGRGLDERSLNAQFYQKCTPTLSTLMHSSYFITQSMQGDLGTEGLGGVTPVFEFFLRRMGYEILSVDTDKEKLVIRYFKPGENRVKVLRHYKVNVGDKYMPDWFAAVLDGLDPSSTVGMIKSCSYLMHKAPFSRIRGYMLDKTFAIVQDDTGPRYAKLLEAGYDVTFYGTFSNPISCFDSSTHQKDLEAAFRKAPVRKIGFRFGYNGAPLVLVSRHPQR